MFNRPEVTRVPFKQPGGRRSDSLRQHKRSSFSEEIKHEMLVDVISRRCCQKDCEDRFRQECTYIFEVAALESSVSSWYFGYFFAQRVPLIHAGFYPLWSGSLQAVLWNKLAMNLLIYLRLCIRNLFPTTLLLAYFGFGSNCQPMLRAGQFQVLN